MPDQPTELEIRERLDDLVPPVDVDAEWAVVSRRLDRDRHRRSARVLAVAAVVVLVVVAVGIGVNTGRSTDPDVTLDVADVPTTSSVDEVATEPVPTTAAVEQGFDPTCEGGHSESYTSTELDIAAMATWRLGSDGVTTRYREDLGMMEVTAPNASGSGGTLVGGHHQLMLIICPGAPTLPPGDGLQPEDPLRTDAAAIEFLAAHRDGGNSNARLPAGGTQGAPPPPVTITEQTAKLVRADEGGGLATAPGFAAWYVLVGFRTEDGVERFSVFSFTPSGDAGTLFRHEAEPYQDEEPELAPPGRDPMAWFDSLPDHAP